ncbi:hypothetical protein WJX72_003424 [[Myrmecia] bisecta]|uniref:Uncharacterized protein n=1 Tax=[Myrmecia] bisecta TaxID=41462 RepID=A0AAW1PFL2_9CHLO
MTQKRLAYNRSSDRFRVLTKRLNQHRADIRWKAVKDPKRAGSLSGRRHRLRAWQLGMRYLIRVLTDRPDVRGKALDTFEVQFGVRKVCVQPEDAWSVNARFDEDYDPREVHQDSYFALMGIADWHYDPHIVRQREGSRLAAYASLQAVCGRRTTFARSLRFRDDDIVKSSVGFSINVEFPAEKRLDQHGVRIAMLDSSGSRHAGGLLELHVAREYKHELEGEERYAGPRLHRGIHVSICLQAALAPRVQAASMRLQDASRAIWDHLAHDIDIQPHSRFCTPDEGMRHMFEAADLGLGRREEASLVEQVAARLIVQLTSMQGYNELAASPSWDILIRWLRSNDDAILIVMENAEMILADETHIEDAMTDAESKGRLMLLEGARICAACNHPQGKHVDPRFVKHFPAMEKEAIAKLPLFR